LPTYGKFKSIRDYLETRVRERDTTITALSEDMFGKRTYLSSVASEQFRPSMERCRQIAEYLGDDPEVILTLAEYMEPPPDQSGVSVAVARKLADLHPRIQTAFLDLVEELGVTTRITGPGLENNEIYIELPDGRSFILDLDKSPADVSESLLRVSVRAALNATLGRE